MGFQEKLIEGKYNYYQNGQSYCEEHFKLFREEKKQGAYTFQVELLSRVETGEFLKVYVDYELNHAFEPKNLRVKRSLGGIKSAERFQVDLKDKKVKYTFTTNDETKEYEKTLSGRFHISAPAFCTSMIMTQAYKIDPVHRTSYDVLSSSNLWTYEGPFEENTIYVELMSLDPKTITIHDKELQASLCNIFAQDKTAKSQGEGYPIYLSKYYQIPYMAEFPDGIKVEIENLKNYESNLTQMFKD